MTQRNRKNYWQQGIKESNLIEFKRELTDKFDAL